VKADIAIIGDRFMLPSAFETAIRRKCGNALAIRSHQTPWPDVAMQHGYAEAGMDGLKEYQGDADEVVAQAGDASIVVTQLAPFSAGVMNRLPNLRMIAASRGGPVNIDMAAADATFSSSIRRAATPAPSPNSPWAPSSRRLG
jgi:D-3-phosphoglycerate dehydrogenase